MVLEMSESWLDMTVMTHYVLLIDAGIAAYYFV